MQLRWMADATPKPLDCSRVRWRWDENAWGVGVGGSAMSCCFLPRLGSLGASELNLAASFLSLDSGCSFIRHAACRDAVLASFSLRLSTADSPSFIHPPAPSHLQRSTVNGPSSIRPFFPPGYPYLMIRCRPSNAGLRHSRKKGCHPESAPTRPLPRPPPLGLLVSFSWSWSLGPIQPRCLPLTTSRPPGDVAAISYDIPDTTTHLIQASLRHLSNRHLTSFFPRLPFMPCRFHRPCLLIDSRFLCRTRAEICAPSSLTPAPRSSPLDRVWDFRPPGALRLRVS